MSPNANLPRRPAAGPFGVISIAPKPRTGNSPPGAESRLATTSLSLLNRAASPQPPSRGLPVNVARRFELRALTRLTSLPWGNSRGCNRTEGAIHDMSCIAERRPVRRDFSRFVANPQTAFAGMSAIGYRPPAAGLFYHTPLPQATPSAHPALSALDPRASLAAPERTRG